MDIISGISSIVTAIVAIVTLFLIYKQLKDVNENILGQTYQNIYERMIEIDRFFIENPELKAYFYYNKEFVNDDENFKAKLHSIAEMMIDYFDSVFYQKFCMRKETFDAKAFYFGDIYNNSPIIREYLDQPGLEHWYSRQFLAFIKSKGTEVKEYLENLSNEELEFKRLKKA